MSWLTRKCGLLEGDIATKGKNRALVVTQKTSTKEEGEFMGIKGTHRGENHACAGDL
jgi:hypothetical protein